MSESELNDQTAVESRRQAIEEAVAMAQKAGDQIINQLGSRLDRSSGARIVSAFRRRINPPRRRGRRPKENITAAVRDWKAGIRGVELCRRHIPDFDKHNHYHRKAERSALMDAIRARIRREKRAASRPLELAL